MTSKEWAKLTAEWMVWGLNFTSEDWIKVKEGERLRKEWKAEIKKRKDFIEWTVDGKAKVYPNRAYGIGSYQLISLQEDLDEK